LGAVSTWLDDVRNLSHGRKSTLEGGDRDEGRAFNKQHPNNGEWHYVNLPVGYTLYAPDGPFSSPDDVVHAIGAAVDVLEGKSERFTKIQALRILVHLVADVHQPLHTISGYFDCTDPTRPKLISNPAFALKFPHDRGGNQLFYTKTLELHALWDTKLPNKLAHSKESEPLAALVKKGSSLTLFPTGGDYHTWPAKWVTDSATEAIAAYKGIVFGPAGIKADGKIERMEIVPPNNYDEQQLPRVKRQPRKGGCASGSTFEQCEVQVKSSIAGKTVELRGEIVLYGEVPEIVVTSGSQARTREQ
jgi:hypothetical protein